jgi:ABC-type polysaccharide/polyol phosphate transport system ATPase subunit
MSEIAIEFRDVKKGFTFWSERTQSLKTWLVNVARGKFGSGQKNRIEVLNGVSFTVKSGEFVAIMGRNGAGKSTTLKLISNIYEPDSGEIVRGGTIAPLIELGAGFDFELSGYENVLLNAAILGFSRSETLKNIDSIIEFSELGDLIEMPIKNYSSGMLVRLGFSVATHLWAPIILVDEVLAVGDVGFQQKCIQKIRQLHAEGRTVLLVTHSPEQAMEYADRTIVIDGGMKVYDGPSKAGVKVYLNQVGVKSDNEDVPNG